MKTLLAVALLIATAAYAGDDPTFNPLAGSADGTAAPTLTAGQSHYMQSCGGCHGILGSSARQTVPELRGQVGRLMCTGAGRQYIVRLPNVAFAGVNDQVLADVLNYVIFSFSNDSLPPGTRPYTAGEVGRLRRMPFKNTKLWDVRQAIMAQTDPRCGQ